MGKIALKRFKVAIIMIFLLLILTACVPGDGSYTTNKPAGFLSGIWHGWISPFSLIFSIGKGSIRMYEPINSGFGYDFGFYMAIISGFGGLSLSRKKKRK